MRAKLSLLVLWAACFLPERTMNWMMPLAFLATLIALCLYVLSQQGPPSVPPPGGPPDMGTPKCSCALSQPIVHELRLHRGLATEKAA